MVIDVLLLLLMLSLSFVCLFGRVIVVQDKRTTLDEDVVVS